MGRLLKSSRMAATMLIGETATTITSGRISPMTVFIGVVAEP